MSDYFQEMGWQPVEPEDIQNHQTLLMARFLSDHGFFSESTDSGNLPPPASKAVVSGLPEKKCTTEDEKCAICLKPNTPDTADEVFKVLPCKHAFHRACIMPWLEKTNSCPLCRHEMQTDDHLYEERKKDRLRARDREQELDQLHNSMFG